MSPLRTAAARCSINVRICFSLSGMFSTQSVRRRRSHAAFAGRVCGLRPRVDARTPVRNHDRVAQLASSCDCLSRMGALPGAHRTGLRTGRRCSGEGMETETI
jgi:hypothetical protein